MDTSVEALWAHHHALWRDPLQVISFWDKASPQDKRSFRHTVRGKWWEALEAAGATLLITREYEHFVFAMSMADGTPHISYMRLPHPSGLAYDPTRRKVHVACTRNPNQVLDLKPVTGAIPRLDVTFDGPRAGQPLVPVGSRFFPGSLYIHDLAMVGGELHANAVGQNAVVRLGSDGQYERVWWPRCIETENGPVFGQNHLQLNSIAAGSDLETSFFSASTDKISARRPGHKNFPVDKRGVIFSGQTREVVVRGLTRPHSARLHRGHIWVDNSGYGELGRIDNSRFIRVARLPGWTRGLCFFQNLAFVATSQVIPRFRQYAPGLEVDRSVCGVHAVDIQSGVILGSFIWPYGNQIFALELVPGDFTTGFPFTTKPASTYERNLFYTFMTEDTNE